MSTLTFLNKFPLIGNKQLKYQINNVKYCKIM